MLSTNKLAPLRWSFCIGTLFLCLHSASRPKTRKQVFEPGPYQRRRRTPLRARLGFRSTSLTRNSGHPPCIDERGRSFIAIVQVGLASNLADLIESPADSISPLKGRELVRKKVRLTSVMAGAFRPVRGNDHFLEANVGFNQGTVCRSSG